MINPRSPNPLALVAELTHRCPLHCVYCSNPLELQARTAELSTEDWSRVFREAAELGVLQADFTGGEPLARPDIVELVRAARAAGLYVSLITSGLPLDEARLDALVQPASTIFNSAFKARAKKPPTKSPAQNPTRKNSASLNGSSRYRVAVTLNFVIHRRNHRPTRRNARARRIFLRQLRRIRQRSVLRLGLRQSRQLLPTRAAARRNRIEFLKKARRTPARKNPRRISSFPITTRNIPNPAWAAGAAN